MATQRTPPAGPSQLTDHLGYWLRMVSNQVSHTFALRLEATGVTVAEWVALRMIFEHEPIIPSRLAEQMQMTRGAISKLVDRLVAKQLVTLTDDPDDKRAHTVRLSRTGRRLVPELAAVADDNDAQFFGVLTAAERRRLEDVLQRLAAHHRATPPID